MSEWRETSIRAVGKVFGGGTPSTDVPENFGGEVPWLTPRDLASVHYRYVSGGARNISFSGLRSSSAQILPPNTVLLTCRAPIGYVAIAKRPLCTSQGFKSIVTKETFSHEFVYYWLKANIDELERHATGSTFKEISGSALKRILIRHPVEKSEQQSIADVLGVLDDKIELNRQLNETLEAMMHAVFKDWFIDFGPTRAKMEGRAPYFAREIWDLFPDCLDDEGKPEGWRRKPLGEIAQFLNGLALQKFPASGLENSLPAIKITELRNGITTKSSRASRKVPKKYLVNDGDFLFSWSASLLAKFWTGGEGALNQHLFKVTSDQYPAWFFSQWIYYHLKEFQAIAASKATTMGHIQRKHLMQAITICPPDEVLSILGQIPNPLVKRTIQNDLESCTLLQTRNLLLPKLMSGEVHYAVAEKTAEKAL